jgi:hypothetical protein
MLDFHEIKSSLMGLNKTELSEIKKVCNTLLERSVELSQEESAFYDVLQNCLNRRGLGSMSVAIFKKKNSAGFNNMCDVAKFVDDWMKSVGVVRRLDKRLFLVILSEIVVTNIEACNVPVNMNTLISFFNNAPAHFDNSFPGYAESNLVMFLINSRKAKR